LFRYQLVGYFLYRKGNNNKNTKHNIFVHCVVCFATGPKLSFKRIHHRVLSSVSSFKFQSLFFSLNSFNSCLRLLAPLLFRHIIPSTTCFRRRFLRSAYLINLTFLPFTYLGCFLLSRPYVILLHFPHGQSNSYPLSPSPVPHIKIFKTHTNIYIYKSFKFNVLALRWM
jgi:hypothetical protein